MCTVSSWGAGSAPVAEVAAVARPRYHFAGTKNAFYTRPPYTNPDLGAGSHVTRFIGLAGVGNVAKQKWLHALGLLPAADMDVAALQQKPEVSFWALGFGYYSCVRQQLLNLAWIAWRLCAIAENCARQS